MATAGERPVLVVLGLDRGRLGLRADDFGAIVEPGTRQEVRERSDIVHEVIEVDGELVRCIDPASLVTSYQRVLGQEGGTVEDQSTGTTVRVVTFDVGPEKFGVDVMEVYEVLAVPDIRVVPDAPEFVEGVADVRGAVAPVIDLRKRFSVPKDQTASGSRLLVVAVEDDRVGLIVDTVPGVVQVPEDAISPAPEFFRGIAARYLDGIARLDDQLIILLDMDEILTSDEKIALKTVVEGEGEPDTGSTEAATGSEPDSETESSDETSRASGKGSKSKTKGSGKGSKGGGSKTKG